MLISICVHVQMQVLLGRNSVTASHTHTHSHPLVISICIRFSWTLWEKTSCSSLWHPFLRHCAIACNMYKCRRKSFCEKNDFLPQKLHDKWQLLHDSVGLHCSNNHNSLSHTYTPYFSTQICNDIWPGVYSEHPCTSTQPVQPFDIYPHSSAKWHFSDTRRAISNLCVIAAANLSNHCSHWHTKSDTHTHSHTHIHTHSHTHAHTYLNIVRVVLCCACQCRRSPWSCILFRCHRQLQSKRNFVVLAHWGRVQIFCCTLLLVISCHFYLTNAMWKGPEFLYVVTNIAQNTNSATNVIKTRNKQQLRCLTTAGQAW